MQRISLLTTQAPLGVLTYKAEVPLQVGQVLRVPLGRNQVEAVVWPKAPDECLPEAKLRVVALAEGLPILSLAMIELVEWIAHYYYAERAAVLKMVLASGVGLGVKSARERGHDSAPLNPAHYTPELNAAQQTAVAHIVEASAQAQPKPILLEGVTGSGKTEVYFEAIAGALKQGKQALVLLPEIALTAPLVERFIKRYGGEPVQWHSHLTPARKRSNFRAIVSGQAQVVVGARSALLLPYAHLGLIIVDEAHEMSFKQEDGVPYHARDVAVMRAKLEAIPIVLATATPALETRVQVERGVYEKLLLPSRYGGAVMPRIEAVNLTRTPPPRGTWLAPPLVQALEETLGLGEQALLFLNRRGYAPLTLCRTCGHRFECPQCTSWMVEHRARHRLQCHHCGYNIPVPFKCPTCNDTESLVACGPGVERIADEVGNLFPEARTVIATSDTLATPEQMKQFVADMESGATQIIIGTQLITKGYHFPNLTLVGVVDADIGLQGGDLRAAERSFQQIAQVAGRAGRAAKMGRVLVQSYEPEAPVIQALLSGDTERFYSLEARMRKAANAPPYARYAALIISSENHDIARDYAAHLAKHAPKIAGVHVYGAAPAPLAKLRARWRFRLLVHLPRTAPLHATLKHWLGAHPVPRHVRMQVDVDPYSFV
jgi:primosomal protein N' (replication factor Y) (superfamily II helicase)